MQMVLHPADTTDSNGPIWTLPGTPPEPEHSVWDEPGLSPELSGTVPDSAVTWHRHFLAMSAATSTRMTWLVTICVALVAGPLAVPGAMMQSVGGSGLLLLVLIGPTAEEVLKVALPAWIVERRPWLYRSPAQILLCAVAAGVAFGVVENLIYLNVYIDKPTPQIVWWRWTVCLLLHASCSLIAGWGVVRTWREFQARQSLPQIALAAPALTTAIVVHGLYNATALILETTHAIF